MPQPRQRSVHCPPQGFVVFLIRCTILRKEAFFSLSQNISHHELPYSVFPNCFSSCPSTSTPSESLSLIHAHCYTCRLTERQTDSTTILRFFPNGPTNISVAPVTHTVGAATTTLSNSERLHNPIPNQQISDPGSLDTSTIDRLIKTFFTVWHPRWPVLHRPSFNWQSVPWGVVWIVLMTGCEVTVG